MTAKAHDDVGNRIDPFKVTCDVCGFTDEFEWRDTSISAALELREKGWSTIHIGMTPFQRHPDLLDDQIDASGMNDMHLCHNCSDPEWVNGTKIHQVFVEALEDSLFCERCGSYLFHDNFKLCGTCMGEIEGEQNEQ